MLEDSIAFLLLLVFYLLWRPYSSEPSGEYRASSATGNPLLDKDDGQLSLEGSPEPTATRYFLSGKSAQGFPGLTGFVPAGDLRRFFLTKNPPSFIFFENSNAVFVDWWDSLAPR